MTNSTYLNPNPLREYRALVLLALRSGLTLELVSRLQALAFQLEG